MKCGKQFRRCLPCRHYRQYRRGEGTRGSALGSDTRSAHREQHGARIQIWNGVPLLPVCFDDGESPVWSVRDITSVYIRPSRCANPGHLQTNQRRHRQGNGLRERNLGFQRSRQTS